MKKIVKGITVVMVAALISGCNDSSCTATDCDTDFVFSFEGIFEGGNGIDEALLVTENGSFNDAYDGVLKLGTDGAVFNNDDNYTDSITSLNLNEGTTLTSGVDTINDINVTSEFAFFTNRAAVRSVYTLTNTTDAAIVFNAAIFNDYGSDGSTVVKYTSNGDTVVEDTDLWFISDDDGDGPDPRIITTRYGTGASVIPIDSAPIADGDGYSSFYYQINIGAGETVRIMNFSELTDPSNDLNISIAAAEDYNDITSLSNAGLLEGLSQDQIDTIVNY